MLIRSRVRVARILSIVAFMLLCLGHGLGYTVFAPPTTQLPPALQALVDAPFVQSILGSHAVAVFGSLWLISAALGFAAVWRRLEAVFWMSVLGVFGLWAGAYFGGAFTVFPRSWLFGTFYASVAAISAAVWVLLSLVTVLSATMERMTSNLNNITSLPNEVEAEGGGTDLRSIAEEEDPDEDDPDEDGTVS